MNDSVTGVFGYAHRESGINLFYKQPASIEKTTPVSPGGPICSL